MAATFAIGQMHPFEWSRRVLVAAVGLGLLFLTALGYVLSQKEDMSSKPYLQILGGGFVFNYRVGETYYGFTARIIRPVSVGSILEASFEDPAGGPPIVVRQRVGTGQLRYAMRTPGLQHVEQDHPYSVEIRLLERVGEGVIWQTRREYRSNIDQSVMPEGPLTEGPGYAPAPAGRTLLNR